MIEEIKSLKCICNVCNHIWIIRNDIATQSKRCPKCQSKKWNHSNPEMKHLNTK